MRGTGLDIRRPTCAVSTAVAALGLVVWAAGCSRHGDNTADAPSSAREIVFAVTVAPVEQGVITETASLLGSLRWVRQTTVKSETAGRVIAVSMREGETFGQDEVLVRIDERDHQIQRQKAEADLRKAMRSLEELKAGTRREVLDRLDAEVQENGAGLMQAEDKLQRAERLFAEGIATKAELVQAQALGAEAEALMNQSKARYEEARNGPRPEAIRVAEAEVDVRQTAVLEAERELEKCVFHAPFAGAILQTFTEVSAYVQVGDPLFEIAATGELEARLEVPERYARHMHPGVRLSLRADAFPESPFTGEVIAIVPIADTRSRNLQLRADLVQAPGGLVAGMFVRGELPVRSSGDATLLPVDAVTLHEDRPVVFAVEGETVQRVDVQLGLQGEVMVELLSPALSLGTQVVTTGGEVLFPGAKVQVGGASTPGAAKPN